MPYQNLNLSVRGSKTGIPVRTLFFSLIGIVFLLLLMHIFTENLSWIPSRKFNLNAEANIPTWYSTILLSSVALISLGVYRSKRDSRPFERYFWLGFCLIYFFFSLDECAQIHEIIDNHTNIKWVTIYAPFSGTFFAMCAYYFCIIRKDDKRLRYWIVGGLVVFAAGGMGFEMADYIGQRHNCVSPTLDQVETMCEEGLELLGTSMVFVGCLLELSLYYRFIHGRQERHSMRGDTVTPSINQRAPLEAQEVNSVV